jgi:hypothetical protein
VQVTIITYVHTVYMALHINGTLCVRLEKSQEA